MEPAAPRDLAGRVARHLAERFERVVASAARVRAGDDDEAIHDLRVSARRLEASLALWGPLLRDGSRRRARRGLRRLRRALGGARELEADAAALCEIQPSLPGASRATAEAIRVRIERRLAAARLAAREQAGVRRIERIRSALERTTGRLGTGFLVLPRDPLTGAAATLAAERAAARDALQLAFAATDDERLHGGRLRLKRLRYALEAVGAVADEGIWRPEAETARRLQHALGRAHDAALLRDRLERRMSRLRAHGAEAAAAALGPLIERVEASRAEAVAAARERAAGWSERAGAPALRVAGVPKP